MNLYGISELIMIRDNYLFVVADTNKIIISWLQMQKYEDDNKYIFLHWQVYFSNTTACLQHSPSLQ